MLSCRAAQVAPTICALALLSQVSSAQPPAAQPSAAQPSAAQPSAAQPSAAQPSAAQPSAAQPRIAVTLDYQAPPGCPAEAEFRDLVAARVGYDPFSAAATLKLQVQLSAQAGQVRGVWKIAEPPQRRELKVTQAECAELVTAFALSVSVAVDQLAAAQASVNPATANPAAATQAPRSDSATETRPPRTLDTQLAQPPPAKPKPKPQPAGPDIELRGSAHGALGLVPQVTAGALLGIAARTRIWSLGVEGRAVLPRSELAADGTGVRGGLIGGGPVACFHFAPGLVCALSLLGAFRGEGLNVDGRDRASTFYASVGARGGLELKLSPALRAQALFDALAPITRTSLRTADRTVWSTPSVAASLGLGIAASFQ